MPDQYYIGQFILKNPSLAQLVLLEAVFDRLGVRYDGHGKQAPRPITRREAEEFCKEIDRREEL